ncbi:GNAT family N-acetyltransferase [Phenylobacterium sp.]|uniref:GNAT family N-acetyltransferase n=1 Tax=Phenylobacterium sp. TaxID=1871053 RepID=UPI00286B3C3E|nr:GNAT family N-acetyltransferase [Phenylobacterium sp.]
MIETERLILRPPEDRDRMALAAMNGDRRVGDWLGSTLTSEQNDAMIDRVLAHITEHGFGFWTVERKADGVIVGMAGLLAMSADMPPGPAVEVGWRLSPANWGHGYASEAAQGAVDWAFAELKPPEVVAITALTNLRSQAVMRRIGMTPEPWRDFNHPRLAADHPLRRHVVYALRR